VEQNMFERLGRCDMKILKATKNPFLMLYLEQNVTNFPNIDVVVQFLNTKLPELTYHDLPSKPSSASSAQRTFSKQLFGKIIKSSIHLTESDIQNLLDLTKELKKYEKDHSEFDMIDESDDFENVYY
jgi:hypothetical protein